MTRSGTAAPADGEIPLDDATYAITADAGDLEVQAVWLVKSIRRQYPEARIVTFVPEDGLDDLDPANSTFLERNTEVFTGEIPIPEDRQSALTRAFVYASETAESEYVVSLDTDMLMTAPLTVPDSGADVFLKPVDVGAAYWGHPDSVPDWKNLYDHVGLSFPTARFESTVDRKPIPPYWNGGVVITRDKGFAEAWLDATAEIYAGDVLESEAGRRKFNEQVSLSLVAAERGVTPLTERQNYPLVARLDCPSDVQIVHYHNVSNLHRIRNPKVREELDEMGLRRGWPGPLTLASQLLDVLYHHSGRVLTYRQKDRLMAFGKSVLPDRLLDSKRSVS